MRSFVFLCFCVFLYLRIRVFRYSWICVLCCVFVLLHLFMYSYSYFCLCKVFICVFIFAQQYLCDLCLCLCICVFYLGELKIDHPFPQFDLPSSQPLVFPIRSDGDKRQTQYLKQCIDLWRFCTLSSLGGFVNLNPSFTQLRRCSRSFHLRWDRGSPELRWKVQNAI